MKKFLLVIICLVIIFLLLYFIPVTANNDVVIKNNFDNVLSFFSKPANWEKWHPVVKELSSKKENAFQFVQDSSNHCFKFLNHEDSLIVSVINPLLYDVQQYSKKSFSSYSYIILPSINTTNSITVRVTQKVPLLFYLFPSLHSSEGKEAGLSLKEYLENPKEFYGYDIKIQNVTDTVFVTEMLTISAKNIFTILSEEFPKLDSFVKNHALSQTNFYSVSYISKGDSIQLILGIPVNKFIRSDTKISCVNIPKGRMLTGTYEGKFSDKKKIYEAFEKYVRDHSFENVGATFESYYNNELPLHDSSTVKFKLYYPIL